MLNEYPKQLYLVGWDDLEQTIVVNNKAEENDAREKGYKMLSDDEEPKPKRGRPAKVDAVEVTEE